MWIESSFQRTAGAREGKANSYVDERGYYLYVSRISPAQLTQVLIAALRLGGATPSVTSGSRDGQPRRLRIATGGDTKEAGIYIWNLTHGGGHARPEHEFRIQITAQPPLDISSDFNALLGYDASRQVFAAWDIRQHADFTSASPSLQIPKDALEDADRNGWGVHRRGNNELVIAFKPALLMTYLEFAPYLHSASDLEIESLLEDVSVIASDRLEGPKADAPAPRTFQTVLVSRRFRSYRFRRDVLEAYDYACAVTGWQLGVIEAAHIVPVTDDRSVDKVTNGIALSPTLHRAFDAGLIYLDEDFEMKLDEKAALRLRESGRGDGLDELVALLGPIRLPKTQQSWPGRDFIRLAKEIRSRSRGAVLD